MLGDGKMDKTVIIFEEVPEHTLFFIIDGNYKHLNDIFINDVESPEEKQVELNKLVYNDEENDLPIDHPLKYYKYEKRTLEDVKKAIKEGAELIVAGLML